MKQHDLKIGVIGAGGRGTLAHHAHQPDKGSRLVGAADIRPEVLKETREQFGSDLFVTGDYRELLGQADIDAVFVTSPDHLHEQHAVDALAAGKHVFLEKPMAISIESCDRILATAQTNKVKLYVGHNMRHMQVVLKMKEIIDSGRIGEIRAAWCRHFVAYGGDAYYKDWHAERKYANSLLLQKGSHDIDVLHWLCNGYTERVTGFGNLSVYNQVTDRRDDSEQPDTSWSDDHWPPLSQAKLNPVIDVEDLSMMLMKLDNGVLASYQQCHYTPDAWRNYTFIGTEGRVENFGHRPGETVVRVWHRRTSYNPYGDEQFFIPSCSGGHGGADPKMVDEFLAYIRGDSKITTSALAARNSVAAGCCAADSLRNDGRPVAVPKLPEQAMSYFLQDVTTVSS